MNIVSGFAGSYINEDGFITPKLAWAITEAVDRLYEPE